MSRRNHNILKKLWVHVQLWSRTIFFLSPWMISRSILNLRRKRLHENVVTQPISLHSSLAKIAILVCCPFPDCKWPELIPWESSGMSFSYNQVRLDFLSVLYFCRDQCNRIMTLMLKCGLKHTNATYWAYSSRGSLVTSNIFLFDCRKIDLAYVTTHCQKTNIRKKKKV